MLIEIQSLLNRIKNRLFHKSRKVFCIGLHKTGTSSLYHLALQYGFNPTHSTDWPNNPEKLERYDFFCDGGSHFDDQHEFDFKRLYQEFPNAKFILQTRETRTWIISKLKHAGWNQNTSIQQDNLDKLLHDDWTYKSLKTIEAFIEHKANYESKVQSFFQQHNPSKLLIINVTNKKTQQAELNKLIKWLGLISLTKPVLPHRNKSKTNVSIPPEVQKWIDIRI